VISLKAYDAIFFAENMLPSFLYPFGPFYQLANYARHFATLIGAVSNVVDPA
jgi:hypothetical protein